MPDETTRDLSPAGRSSEERPLKRQTLFISLALLLGFLAGVGFRDLLNMTSWPGQRQPLVEGPSATNTFAQSTATATQPFVSPTATASLTPTPISKPTPERAPTVTPQPPPPTPTPRRPVEKVTKMGVGVYSSGGGHLIDLLFRTQPTTILLMDPDPAFAKEVRRWFPKAFIVGRRFLLQQPLDNPAVRGEQIADNVAALAVPLKGVVNAWMSYNEPVNTGDYEAYKLYNIFQAAFARKLQGTYGIDAVAGNEGVGVVWPDDYPKYFAEAIRASKYFGIHAYPPEKAGSMKEEADWYALRYRRIHQALERAGIKHGPFIITESGLWAGHRGYTTEQSFADDLIWFTDELEKDPYVLGHAIYGIFATDEADNSDISRYPALMDRLGQYTPRR